MLYEYALLSVVIASGYWGIHFLRFPPSGTRLYGLMQAAAAVLCGVGFWGRNADGSAYGVAGAVGLGAGVCLLILGPFMRSLARRFAAAERLGIASRLLDVAEVLAPGSGVAEERALLGAMSEIRDGKVEPTVDALTAAKDRAPQDARLAIDERITMLYLAAYRWHDAIAHAESNLPAVTDPTAPDLASPSLRDALGVTPPVWVELLGAYARTGDLEQAAKMMVRLEDVCLGRHDGGLWLHRARMMFLALAGRPDAVRVLVDPPQAGHMSQPARTYWLAVALHHQGDRAAATAAYEKARGGTRGRPRELIDAALGMLSDSGFGPVHLSPEVSEVVARVEAQPLPAPIRATRVARPWATWGLLVALLGAAALISWMVGSSSDHGVIIRAGAMVRGLIDQGEWWRLVTCIFVHVGTIHLVVNAIGLFMLGKIAEDLFGSLRTLAIFGGAGIAGAVAAYLGSPVPMSAGASGAVFGLLGAVFIELTLHRERYRVAWKRGIWGGLAVIAVAQIAVGFLYPVIDQWAHAAGLVSGLVLGAILSQHTRWAGATRIVSAVIAVAFVGAGAVATVLVARTSLHDSFAQGSLVRRDLGQLAITVPEPWFAADGILADPDRLIYMHLHRLPLVDVIAQTAEWSSAVQVELTKESFDRIEVSKQRVVALPPLWEGSELVGSVVDPLGYTQRYRIVVATKPFGESLIAVWFYAPEMIAHEASTLFVPWLQSVEPLPVPISDAP